MKNIGVVRLFCVAALAGLLSACNSNPSHETTCSPPSGHNLDQAMSAARFDLETGCEAHFDDYLVRLLAIAEGDPGKENKAKFSDFLLWANEEGLLSKRQAREVYNRYFGIKYVSMIGGIQRLFGSLPPSAGSDAGDEGATLGQGNEATQGV